MDSDSEYYNIYSKEPNTKVTIYASILYFVIVIYESMNFYIVPWFITDTGSAMIVMLGIFTPHYGVGIRCITYN